MPNDLRAVWPNLSRDQKNALVVMDNESERKEERSTWGELSKTPLWPGMLPDFCGSWEGFGRISAECGNQGWRWTVFSEPFGRFCATIDASQATTQPSAPEALALAFVLASEVEVPAEWGGGGPMSYGDNYDDGIATEREAWEDEIGDLLQEYGAPPIRDPGKNGPTRREILETLVRAAIKAYPREAT